MANTIDTIVPKILARGMLSLREKAIMPRLVNNDFSAEAAQKGDSIEVPVSGAVTASDVVPGATAPDPADTAITSHTLKLDNWKKASFHLTDKDLARVDADTHFIPYQLQEAVGALAEAVNKSFMDQIGLAANIIGNTGKQMFTTDAAEAGKDHHRVNPAIVSRRILNKALAPKEGRFGILGYEMEAAALALSEFADAEKSGDSGVRMEGEIGRKYGINWFASANTYSHAATTGLASNFGFATAYSEGDTVLTFANTGNRMLKPGDVIVEKSSKTPLASIARKGDGNNYETAMPLAKRVTGGHSGTSIAVLDDHASGAIFHRDAFAFATRPLASMTEEYGFGNRILSVTDPVSGLSLRLEVSRQYKQTVWELDILWGVAAVRPEFMVRLLSS